VNIACAILAGGQATRMGGRAKSFLLVDGQRIIDRQLEVLRPRAHSILVVGGDPEAFAELGLSVIPDEIRGAGPLGGIQTALQHTRADAVLAIGCDMPFVDDAVLDLVLANAPEMDAVVPTLGGLDEPLFARYGRACVAAIRARLARGERKVSGIFDDVHTLRVAADAHRSALANLNSPEDLNPNML
jgi:molybdenum cofactor guanylyltransferase